MDTGEKLDKLKTWAVDNYFQFRGVMSPYLENLPTSVTKAEDSERELMEHDETQEEGGFGS